jgi:lipopolysaccharide transport system ATP-binding protein
VRVKTEDGQVKERIDVRHPVTIEMEYEVIQSGWQLIPSFSFYNDTGLEIFSTDSLDPAWRNQPYPEGQYLSAVTIPGNFLAEGNHCIWAHMATRNPLRMEFSESDVVSFTVYDNCEGDSARGDWPFEWGGVVRPLLEWKTCQQ